MLNNYAWNASVEAFVAGCAQGVYMKMRAENIGQQQAENELKETIRACISDEAQHELLIAFGRGCLCILMITGAWNEQVPR